MKMELNGVWLDTDKDLALCGAFDSNQELTLHKTDNGRFYTHRVEYNQIGEIESEEVGLHNKEEVAKIMMGVGFSNETIKNETGINIKRLKKRNYN